MTFQKLKSVAISDGERFLQRLPQKTHHLYVGFIAQEVAVSNWSYINIELPAANQKLNDVVVVGYKNLLL